MADRWIIIPGWDKFQHYKNRNPPWIKDYLEQLDRDEYLGLTFAERGLLSDLRKLYARNDSAYRGDTTSLRRALHQRVSERSLKRLVDAGYIQFAASKPLAKVVQPASTKRNREEKKGKQTKNQANPNGERPVKRCPECGIALTPPLTLAEHVHLQHESPASQANKVDLQQGEDQW